MTDSSPPIVNTVEQFEVAIAAAQRSFTKQLAVLRTQYTIRLRDEAWGDPAKAEAIGAEWDGEIVALTDANKARLAAIPKPPSTEARR